MTVSDAASSLHDFVVLGGGICGLTAAWQLAAGGARVALMEKQETLGGVMQTARDGEWLYELGPNSLGFTRDDDIHLMLRELGLDRALEYHAVRESDRYVWRGGQLRRVPVSPLQLLRKSAISRRALSRALPALWRPASNRGTDVSVGAFFSPLLGRAAVDQLLTPALAGIYAADPFSLGMESVMPRLHQAMQQHPTLLRAMKSLRSPEAKAGKAQRPTRVIGSFKEGMTTLPSAMAKAARSAGADLRSGCAVTRLERSGESWLIHMAQLPPIAARHVVCAVPAAQAADLMHEHSPHLAGHLSQVRSVPMAIVHLGVAERDTPVAHSGFGFLATRDSGIRSLGMIWSDRMFGGRAPAGHRLFTVFMGGQVDPHVMEKSDDELREIALADLRRVMRWRGEQPAAWRITRYPAAIPLMEVGHAARVRAIKEALPEGVSLSGNYVTGVSIPSCMRAAKSLALELLK